MKPRGVWRPWLTLRNHNHPISWGGALHDCRSDQKQPPLHIIMESFHHLRGHRDCHQCRLSGLCSPPSLLVRHAQLSMERRLIGLKSKDGPLEKHNRHLLTHVSRAPRSWVPPANSSTCTWCLCPGPNHSHQSLQRHDHRTSPASSSLLVDTADTTRAVPKPDGPATSIVQAHPTVEMNRTLSASHGSVSDDRPIGPTLFGNRSCSQLGSIAGRCYVYWSVCPKKNRHHGNHQPHRAFETVCWFFASLERASLFPRTIRPHVGVHHTAKNCPPSCTTVLLTSRFLKPILTTAERDGLEAKGGLLSHGYDYIILD